MSDTASPPDLNAALRIDQACLRFEKDWKTASLTNPGPRLEDYLANAIEADKETLLRELLPIEVFHRRRLGASLTTRDYLQRFPGLDTEWIAQVVGDAPPTPTVDLARELQSLPLLTPTQQADLPQLHSLFAIPHLLAAELLQRGWLTAFQVKRLLQGKGTELLLGPYVLLEELGQGGMGTVYRVRHARLGKLVALKVIRRDHVASADAVRRFQREIRAASQLSHPNIVHALDADRAGDTHFFAMELLAGTDLARVLKERGPLPVAEACEYVRQAALGLQHAFEKGLVHRDVKPSNLMLAPAGSPSSGSAATASTVKLLDLGLARLAAREGESSTKLTATGAAFGTADYLAPEQADEAHTVDIRADIYSLGCTLYHLLTSRVPFPGGSFVQKAVRHRLDEPTPVEQLRPEIPSGVGAVVRTMMAKRPEARYQTPAEVVAALTAVLRTLVGSAEPPRSPFAEFPERERSQHPSRPSPRRIAFAIAVGVVLSAAVALLLFRPWSRPPEVATPPLVVHTPATPSPPRPVLLPSRTKALAALRAWGAELELEEKGQETVVITVNLSQRQIANDDLLNVRAFPELQRLRLMKTPISDRGLVHLQELTNLWELNLIGTAITNRGLASLKSLKNLIQLHLEETAITDAGLGHLDAFPQLNYLTLHGTPVTDAGLALLPSLPRLSRMTLGPSITDAGLAHLEDRVSLQSLHLSSSVGFTDTGASRLKKLIHLGYLSLQKSRVTDAGLEVLGPMRELQYLNLSETKLTGAFLKHLTCQKRLMNLHLNQTAVTDEALKDLVGMTELVGLGLDGTKVSDNGLQHLLQLPALSQLSLLDSAVTSEGVRRFRAARPKVNVVH